MLIFMKIKIIDAYYAKNLDAYLSENKSEPRGDPFKLRNLLNSENSFSADLRRLEIQKANK